MSEPDASVVFHGSVTLPSWYRAGSAAAGRVPADSPAVPVPQDLLDRYDAALQAVQALAAELRPYEQQAAELRLQANRARYDAEQARKDAEHDARVAALRAQKQALEDRHGKAEWVIVTKRVRNENTGYYRDTGDTLHHSSCAIVTKVRAKYEENGEGTHATSNLRPDEAVARYATRYKHLKNATVKPCGRCKPTLIAAKGDAYLAAGIKPDEIRRMEETDGPIPLEHIQALAALRQGTTGRLYLVA